MVLSMEPQISNIKLPWPARQGRQNKSQIQNSKMGDTGECGKVYDIRERLLLFAKRILEICKRLPRTPECNKIREQLGSAGSSIGANYEEADGAITKKDFVNKVVIARKEAKETRYWLRLISGVYIAEREIARDIRESEEIINILSSILRKSGVTRRR